MNTSSLRSILTALTLVVTLGATPACAQEATSAPEPEPWLKLDEPREGVLELSVGERVYTKAGMPDIVLVGAIHIGDPRYYRHLQKTLDAFDLVLYEGVGPEGMGDLEDLSDDERSQRTEDRIRLLAILLERDKRDAQSAESERVWEGYPVSLEALRERMETFAGVRQLELFDAAISDGWARPLEYRATDDGADFIIRSLGADGVEGGRGADRDLSFAIQPALSRRELGAEPGLQQRMAQTFGLAFQGDVMTHDHPRYVNSDMSIDEIRVLLEERGADGGMIFGMLDGSSGMANAANLVFGIIEFIPGGAAMGKLMIMELLANADVALASAGNQPGMEGMGALLEVIIDDRNTKVLDDLRSYTREEDAPDRIAVIYGAGHMPDLVERMRHEMGYELASSAWNRAIRLDLNRAGIPPAQATLMRAQIRGQLEMMRRAAEEEG